ncbi:hypothetical protein [Burkholderia cepacia]|uniref:hypothetical protein n=1 Tax=Burkholderia cepacia TaxID=292 RepID=UPI002ED0AE93
MNVAVTPPMVPVGVGFGGEVVDPLPSATSPALLAVAFWPIAIAPFAFAFAVSPTATLLVPAALAATPAASELTPDAPLLL